MIIATTAFRWVTTWRNCNNFSAVTLKCQPDRIEELKEQHSCIGKPFNESPRYWIGVDPTMTPDTLLKELTLNSYTLVREKYQQKHPPKP